MDRKTFIGGVTASVLSMIMAGSVMAHQATPDATPEATPVERPVAQGLQASVSRYFIPVGVPSSGIWRVEARIAEFETANQAQAVVSDWFAQVEELASDEYVLQLFPIAVETVADTTRAAVGIATKQKDPDLEFDVTALAMTDDTLLYTFVMWSDYANGPEELLSAAKRTLGIEPLEFAGFPDVPYKTGGLWDLLPRIEHMPQGLTWYGDRYPCVGVFGINENECVED